MEKKVPDKLHDTLRDTNATKLFCAHLVSDLCAENFDFYVAVPKVRTVAQAERLFEEFIAIGSPGELNIGYQDRAPAIDLIEGPDADKTVAAWKTVLKSLRTEVANLMSTNFVFPYLKSDAFHNYYVKPAKPAIVAKKLGVKTREGKAKVAEAMWLCVRGRVKEAEEIGWQLFRDKKEKYYRTTHKDFVIAIWSGKFKKPIEKTSRDTKDELRNASLAQDRRAVTPSQIKRQCKLLDIKKFEHRDTPDSITNILEFLAEGEVRRAKQEYERNVQRREPELQGDRHNALDWALFLSAMRRAKIV